ncbi:MAG: Ig-like domain-containing protein [Lachnospiraceae bacterium]|nr:Ig-like domain-containing protein [Lachnospiraceae bacterium]
MKKLFNHRKRPYDDKIDYDEWNDIEQSGEEEYAGEDEYDSAEEYDFAETESEYIEEDAEQDGEFYAEDEYLESEPEREEAGYDEVDYAEGGFESEDEYYAEDAEYADDAEGDLESEDEYYTGEIEYTDDIEGDLESDDEYYADEYSDDEEYDDEYDEEYDDEDEILSLFRHKDSQPRKKARSGPVLGFLNMGTMDKIITCTGVIVLIVALITGGIYASSRILDNQIESFVTVGTQLADIDLPGKAGLLAVADAEAARKAAADALKAQEEEQKRLEEEAKEKDKEYEEQEYANAITVVMNMTSIQKDLKIKFVNKKTDKLISNVPFKVTVTRPDGSTETWSDDDMDGIIYKTKLDGGIYKVQAAELSGDKYRNYSLPASAQKVEVKKEIEYKKVDVKDEIKTEAEVDVKKEDTKKNETQVEIKLEDTVGWVDSTTTLVNYKEVEKSTISDPATLVYSGSFRRLAQVTTESTSQTTTVTTPATTPVSYTGTISDSSKTLKVGETFTLTASVEGVKLTEVKWTSSNESIAKITGSGAQITVEAVGEGTAFISYTASGTTIGSDEVSSGNAVTDLQGATCTVKVEKAVALTKGTLSADVTAPAMAVGGKVSVKTAASGFTEGKALAYTISNSKADIADATVDEQGNVTITGKATGETTVTVGVNYKEGGSDATKATLDLNVKVTGALAITLDKTTATAYIGTPLAITAALTNAVNGTAVTAESANAGIATVSVDKNVVTVTGVATGSVDITVKYTENGQEVKAVCTVTVKNDPKNDRTNKLKDVNGNQIYVQEAGNYREAYYADYYTASKFYVKGEAKYTGWQTIDGSVYYFDANGNKVTGEQVIQGAKYNFGPNGVLNTGSGTRGIDVSKWNGNIDWNAVKNSGIEYVIIRCGYRGSSQGALIEDPKYKTNIQGAINAGLKVGVYFFTQAISEAEAVEEASMVLELVKNYKISYPVFLDVEASGGRADSIDKATRTAVCKAFCQTIQSGGYKAGVYANRNWLTEKIDASALGSYKIWLAQYADKPTYSGRYDIWQYQSTGKVSGINGDVDMNWSYLGY